MMEPERKIEKLLRDFARKRREEPGEPLELSPAARRRLQAEAARRAAKSAEDNFFLKLLGGLRPAFGVAVGLAVVCLVAAIWLPALSKAKSRSQSVSAASNLRQIGVAALIFAEDHTNRLPASLDEMKEVLHSDNVLKDPVTGQPFVYVGAGRDVSTLSKDSMLAYSPSDGKNRRVLFADGSVQTVDTTRFAGLSGPMQLASANASRLDGLEKKGAAPAAPATPPSVARESDQESRGKRDVAPPAQAAPAAEPAGSAGKLSMNLADKSSATPPAAAQTAVRSYWLGDAVAVTNRMDGQKPVDADAVLNGVLVSFVIEQNGQTLRIVDSDGSVYEGLLQPESATGKEEFAGAQAKAPARNQAATPAQNYVFSCTGTNRTLRQNVVFSGNLFFLDAPGSRAQPAAAGAELQSTLQFTNSRIRGTVLVNDRVIPITASPAKSAAR